MSRIEELEKRLEADPNSRIFVQLAEAYRKEGLLENAIEVCEAGLAKHPQYPSARVALGRALLEAETFERAREEFEAVLEQVPDNILANKFLGDTYHRLGRYDDAIQKYEIAQTFSPEDSELGLRIAAVREDMTGVDDETLVDDALPPAPDAGTANDPQAAGPFVADAPDGAVGAASDDSWAAPPSDIVDSEGFFAGDVEPGDQPPSHVEEDLAPIPLVEVAEPMVLEDRAYVPPEPVVAEPEEPAAPDVTDALPIEPIPMEPIPMEPILAEPIPTETASAEPIVVSPPQEPPVVEQAALEPEWVTPDAAFPPDLEPEPEPMVASPEPQAEAGEAGEIETPTVAELYAEQGHLDKAIDVYKNLLAREPGRAQYLDRLQELEMQRAAPKTPEPASGTPAADPSTKVVSSQDAVDTLQKWLDAIQQSRRA